MSYSSNNNILLFQCRKLLLFVCFLEELFRRVNNCAEIYQAEMGVLLTENRWIHRYVVFCLQILKTEDKIFIFETIALVKVSL